LSVWSYAQSTILNPHSRACFWKHPGQATRMVMGVLGNALLNVSEKVRPSYRQSCPVCRWEGRRFRTYVSPDIVIPSSICPVCGSFERHRHLVLGMRDVLSERSRVPRSLLGLSLSQSIRYLLAHEGLGRCFRSDFDNRDPRYEPDIIVDLAQASFRDEAFDWVVCSHVLEHIADLDRAVDELFRVLRPGGLAWIQVAYQEAEPRSRRIPLEPHEIDAHAWRFGQDFTGRLEREGWDVTCVHAADLELDVRQHHGLHPVERYWLVSKHS